MTVLTVYIIWLSLLFLTAQFKLSFTFLLTSGSLEASYGLVFCFVVYLLADF